MSSQAGHHFCKSKIQRQRNMLYFRIMYVSKGIYQTHSKGVCVREGNTNMIGEYGWEGNKKN